MAISDVPEREARRATEAGGAARSGWASGLSRRLELAPLALHLAAWLAVMRFFIVQGDDFPNAGVGGQPHGAMSPGQWVASYWYDYTEVNGRFADALTRLLLIPGPGLWQILAPVAFTATCALLFIWARGRGPGRSPVWSDGAAAGRPAPALAIASCLLFPLLIAQRPAVAGDAVFWMSAAVSYVVSAAFALVGGWPFVAACTGARVRGLLRLAAPVCIVLAQVNHEISSWTLLAVVVTAWLLLRRTGRPAPDRPYLVACSVLALGGFLWQLFAPGVWKRLLLYQDQAPTGLSAGQTLLKRLADGAQALVDTDRIVLCAAVLLSCAAAAVLRPRLRRMAGLSLALLIALLVLVQYRAVSSRPYAGPTVPLTAGQVALALGLVATLAVLGGAVLRLLLALLDRLGPAPVLAMVAALAATAIPIGLGLRGNRAYVMAGLWLYAVALTVAVALADAVRAEAVGRSRRERARGAPDAVGVHRALVAMVAAACLALVPTVADSWSAMRANDQVWQRTAAQIEEATQGRGVRVVIPSAFPRPEYLYGSAFNRRRYEAPIRLYYAIPSQVRLDWGTP